MILRVFCFLLCCAPLISSEVVGVYFSSEEHVGERLVDMINKEKEQVQVAVYRLSDQKVSEALIAAMKRGVKVKVITNKDSPTLAFRVLKKAGVDVVTAKKESKNSLMHHKFVLFSKNEADKSLVWTGSFNFTYAASKHHRENVVVLEGSDVYARYQKEFDSL